VRSLPPEPELLVMGSQKDLIHALVAQVWEIEDVSKATANFTQPEKVRKNEIRRLL
jgi:hypothetical protein